MDFTNSTFNSFNSNIPDSNISHVSNSNSSSSSSSNNNRKSSGIGKSVGIDLEKARKSREEQNTQLRKDKRLETINRHRRRVSEPDDVVTAGADGVDQTVLANFRQMLEGDDYEQQLEGATHFRKILATEKTPPIELVIKTGVVPRLVQLLDQRRDKSKIQVEIAWSLTNLACGEADQIALLASLGVIPVILSILSSSCDEKVRDQLLWTTSNLTADVECRRMFIERGLVNVLSSQLGIGDNLMPKTPSLNTMHHVACICINLLRHGTPYTSEIIFQIVIIVSELLQSPDGECVSDVNKALYFLCTESPENITLLLEQGVASRLRELCDKPETRESSVKVLSSMLKSTTTLHRRILLSERFRSIIGVLVAEMNQASFDETRNEICAALCSIANNDYKYIVSYIGDIFNILESQSQKDCFAVNIKLGTLITYIIPHLSHDQLKVCGIQCVTIIWSLLRILGQVIPLDILVLLLNSLKKIAEWALREGTPIRGEGCLDMESIKDFIGNFTTCPNHDVATIAAQLERILDQNFFTDEFAM